MTDDAPSSAITGRCYCGRTRIAATCAPAAVTYCHCSDCRRVTGAPVAAFAAFAEADITLTPDEGHAANTTPGVTRTFCQGCGSPLTGRYDYLPGRVYIALGLLDQAGDLPPALHAHHDNRLPWLHLDDGLERHASSARTRLNRS